MAKPKSPFSLLKPKIDVTASAKTKRRRKAGVTPQHDVKAASLANLRRGGRDTDEPKPLPVLDEPTAGMYVKLRAAGLPPLDAVAYFTRGTKHTKAALEQCALAWETSALVQFAWDVWHGGTWPDLNIDERLRLASEHHLSQMAYHLYTSDFNAKDADLRRMREAREAITGYLKDSSGEGAFGEFIKDMLKRVQADDGADGPPVLKALQVEQIDKPLRES